MELRYDRSVSVAITVNIEHDQVSVMSRVKSANQGDIPLHSGMTPHFRCSPDIFYCSLKMMACETTRTLRGTSNKTQAPKLLNMKLVEEQRVNADGPKTNWIIDARRDVPYWACQSRKNGPLPTATSISRRFYFFESPT